jgi:hypothetical protein
MADLQLEMAVDLIHRALPGCSVRHLLEHPLSQADENLAKNKLSEETIRSLRILREYHEKKNQEWHQSQTRTDEFQQIYFLLAKKSHLAIPGSEKVLASIKGILKSRGVQVFTINYEVWDLDKGSIGVAGPSGPSGPGGTGVCGGPGAIGDPGVPQGNSSWAGEPGTPGEPGASWANSPLNIELLRSLSTILNAHQDICDACDREEIKDGPIVEANGRIGTEVMKHLPG